MILSNGLNTIELGSISWRQILNQNFVKLDPIIAFKGISNNSTITDSLAISNIENTEYTSSITMGNLSETNGNNSIAIGVESKTKKNSISIGYQAKAAGEENIAIGYQVNSTANEVNNKNNIVIGYKAICNNTDNIVIGKNANIKNEYNNNVKGSIALGQDVKVINANTVNLNNACYKTIYNNKDINNNILTAIPLVDGFSFRFENINQFCYFKVKIIFSNQSNGNVKVFNLDMLTYCTSVGVVTIKSKNKTVVYSDVDYIDADIDFLPASEAFFLDFLVNTNNINTNITAELEYNFISA